MALAILHLHLSASTNMRLLPLTLLITVSESIRHDKPSETCTTPACIHASSEILYNLSPNFKDVDACTDFEELVCGGWKERHDLRPDQSSSSTLSIMSETNQMLLKHLLESPYPTESAVSISLEAINEPSNAARHLGLAPSNVTKFGWT